MKIYVENKIDTAYIEVNNGCELKFEFMQCDEFGTENKETRLRVTRLNEKGEREKVENISEGDLVLLWNRYIYCKENGENIM